MKKKYQVEIEEKLQKVVEEEANSIEEALEIVQQKYDEGEYELNYENFMGEEIRAFGESKELNISKDFVFDINSGKAILLEGNEKIAIIKRLDDNEEHNNYIVATNLTYNNKIDRFEWNQVKHCNNLLEAIEYYEELTEHELELKLSKIKNELPNYKKIQIYDILLDREFEGNNYSETIKWLHDLELSNEDICLITSLEKDELEDILDECEEDEEI